MENLSLVDASLSDKEYLARIGVNNQKLFSDHYLVNRLPNSPAWNIDPPHLSALKNRIEQLIASLNPEETRPEEAQTEEELIRPILKLLGFEYDVQARTKRQGKTRKPDYALFENLSAKSKATRHRTHADQYYPHALAICEAKKWNRPLNNRVPEDDLDPSDATGQIVRYLSDIDVAANGHPSWGILTNGRVWRLFYFRSRSRTQNFYEVDLLQLFSSENPDALKYFVLIFGRDAFVAELVTNKSRLETVIAESESYAVEVGERLKGLIFSDIFRSLAKGFVECRRQEKQVAAETEESLKLIFEATLTLLYRILFLLYAEALDLLPVSDRKGYYLHSITKLKEGVAEAIDSGQAFGHRSHEFWDHLSNLFQIIDQGDPGLNVPQYNGGLFDNGSTSSPQNLFLKEHCIADSYLAPALDKLVREYVGGNQTPQFVDYKSLGVAQLGSIYEGLLEFHVKIAAEDLAIVKEKGREIFKAVSTVSGMKPSELVAKGDVYLENEKHERKASGSYYTPKYVVEYIIANTVGPALEEKFGTVEQLLGALAKLQSSKSKAKASKSIRYLAGQIEDLTKKILNALFDVKVLDPAMGSGHFLVRAVDFISDEIIDFLTRHPQNPVVTEVEKMRRRIIESLAEQNVQIDMARLTDNNLIKRMVMKRCIYGVDLNPMAVELAKVSLWLDSFTLGAPLSFLDHHLKCGNSLVGAGDVREHIPEGTTRYDDFIRAMSDLAVIGQLADSTTAEVKSSRLLFDEVQKLVGPTRDRLNVQVASKFLKIDEAAARHAMVWAYREPSKRVAREQLERNSLEIFGECLKMAKKEYFFHWEIEFPDIFYDVREGTERAYDRKDNPGFDVVAGNPPYVRQETLGEIKEYLKDAYPDVFSGTADIYVYFYDSAHRLLKQGGRFGMITSNKFMRARYGEPLRAFLTQRHAIEQIVDFGDLPVFEDATTYTCVVLTRAKQPQTGVTKYTKVASLNFNSLEEVVRDSEIEIAPHSLQENGWALTSREEQAILAKMAAMGTPLKEYCKETIRRGVLTGLNEAFFIDRATRDRLIAEDPKSSEIIKPLAVGEDIRRYDIRFCDRYLIWTYIGVPIERYPAVFAHLKKFQPALEKRWDKGEHWWELRACDYYEDFERPKIVYQDIAKTNSFALDIARHFTNNTTYFVPGADSYILALLNSKLMYYYFVHLSVQFRGGYVRYYSQYVLQLPIQRCCP